MRRDHVILGGTDILDQPSAAVSTAQLHDCSEWLVPWILVPHPGMHCYWRIASNTLYTTLLGRQDAPGLVYFACDMRSYTQFHKSGLPFGLRSCRISPPYFIADCHQRSLISIVLWFILGIIVTDFFSEVRHLFAW